MFQRVQPTSGMLDVPLLQLSPVDTFDVRHLLENVSILGQPGSGKTSGSGAHLAKAALRAGMGILVLCAKSDERTLWERYCEETGRTGSLIVFDGKQHRYNFIAAELARLGIGAISSIIDFILQIMESARTLGGSTRGDDVFWTDFVKLVLRHALPILYYAKGTITIADVVAFVQSAPSVSENMYNDEWIKNSFFAECCIDAYDRMPPELVKQLSSFWRDSWVNLDPKTRTNGAISLITALDRFNHGWLREAFCTDSTIAMELLAHGAVIVLDLPAVTHMEDGILGQRLLKFVTQRMLLARPSFGAAHAARVVVIWMDEAPVFVDSNDAKFLALCRSSLSCMVLMAQSLPSYYAVMGGDNARDRVDQLLSNCTTRIWHCSSCPITGKVAAETIGRGLHRRGNFSEGSSESRSHGVNLGDSTQWGTSSGSGGSVSFGGGQQGASYSTSWNSGRSSGGGETRGRNRGESDTSSVSHGYSEQMDFLFEPSAFSNLRTGGPHNQGIVSCVWFQGGRQFRASNGCSLYVEFRQ